MSRLVGLLMAVCLGAAAQAAGPSVRVVRFDTDINGASSKRITEAIDAAGREHDALVLIELDTPGGAVDATEAVTKKILASRVPVAVWVGPAGARAASGGFYLLIAADIAVMAPGTRTGAASVVFGMGKNEEGDVLLKKATSDLAAGCRSIAEHRGRNVDACEKAVVSAESFTDGAALAAGLIDLVAKDRAELLTRLDGRQVTRFDGTTVTLALADPQIVEPHRTRAERAEERLGGFLSNPTVVYLLFLIGMAGLYAEFNHPGAWLPGIAGVVALILFAVGAQHLPVSAIGILLVLIGLVLFVLEVKIVSHGLLALGGTVFLVLGSVMLFPGSTGSVKPPLAVILPGSLLLAGFCALAARMAVAARKVPVASGAEGLRGEIGVVEQSLDPEGTVFVHGELWKATAASGPVPAGSRVRVLNVRDLIVDVEPVDAKS